MGCWGSSPANIASSSATARLCYPACTCAAPASWLPPLANQLPPPPPPSSPPPGRREENSSGVLSSRLATDTLHLRGAVGDVLGLVALNVGAAAAPPTCAA
jgi:hypothetical protein